MEQLKENSLYSSDASRKELVDDKEATMTALIINLFGTLGLLKIDAKKVKARRILNSQEQLQIGKIAETHNDMVLVIRLGVDAGIVPTPVAAQMIRLLRELRRKKAAEQADIDDDQLRDWLQKMHWRSNPPVQQLRSVVLDFFDGLTTLEEFTARLYDKLFERKELIVNYGMEFFPMARQYQGLFNEIKRNSKDWNEVDDGTYDPVSAEQRINDLIDRLLDPKVTRDEVESIKNILLSLNANREIAERIIARTVPSKIHLEAMELPEGYSSMISGPWSVVKDLDDEIYQTLNAVFASLHLNKYWTDLDSFTAGFYTLSDLKISFDEKVINSGFKIAGMTLNDAHKKIGDFIRDMIVMAVVDAKDVTAWKKIRESIRYINRKDYSKTLKLFDPEEIHKTIYGLMLSEKDIAMFFVKSIMGSISPIHGITPFPVIVADLKRAGVEIEHDKALIKGVDTNYPEEIEFLDTLGTEFGGGYHIDYADVSKDDEWSELVARFGDGYDKFIRALYVHFQKFVESAKPKDHDDMFGHLFGVGKSTRDFGRPEEAAAFFESLSKHPRLKESIVKYVKTLLNTQESYMNEQASAFLTNLHKHLMSQMMEVDMSKLYRARPTNRGEALEIGGAGSFAYSALGRPSNINVMDRADAKILAMAFHEANPTAVLSYYATDVGDFDSATQVQLAHNFLKHAATNEGLQLESFMTSDIAHGLGTEEWTRLMTVFTSKDGDEHTDADRNVVISKAMEYGVKFNSLIPNDILSSFIIGMIGSGLDVSDYQNAVDGFTDQQIRDVTGAVFEAFVGYDNIWSASSFLTRNLQNPVAREHFIKLFQESDRKGAVMDNMSDEAAAGFLPKDQYLVTLKIKLAQSETLAEKLSHASISRLFLKREDVTKEDVEMILGRIGGLIQQFDSGDQGGDDDGYVDDVVTLDGIAFTVTSVLETVIDRFPDSVDNAMMVVSGSALLQSVVESLAQANVVENLSGPYHNDIIRPYTVQTREEILRSMRFNKINIKGVLGDFYDPKKTFSENLKTAKSAKVTLEPLKVVQVEATEDQLVEATAMIEGFNRHAHGGKARLGILVIRMFDVSIPQQHAQWPAFKARMEANNLPNDYMSTVFHGTGSVAASMILRYGFTIPEFTADAGMSGRALGDGVYFTDVSDKATLYIGDSGYRGGLSGYLFEMDAQLGNPAIRDSSPSPDTDGPVFNHRSGGFPEATNHQDFISPEWAVFDPHAQVRIRRAYEVRIMDGAKIEALVKGKVTYQKLVAEEEETMSFKEFQLMKAEGGKEKHTATYIFADGMVPVGRGEAIPWKKAKIKGVQIESGQQGVIISVTSSRVKEDTVYRDCSGGEFALSSAYGRYAYQLGLIK